jgi:hypothetical protein
MVGEQAFLNNGHRRTGHLLPDDPGSQVHTGHLHMNTGFACINPAMPTANTAGDTIKVTQRLLAANKVLRNSMRAINCTRTFGNRITLSSIPMARQKYFVRILYLF